MGCCDKRESQRGIGRCVFCGSPLHGFSLGELRGWCSEPKCQGSKINSPAGQPWISVAPVAPVPTRANTRVDGS